MIKGGSLERTRLSLTLVFKQSPFGDNVLFEGSSVRPHRRSKPSMMGQCLQFRVLHRGVLHQRCWSRIAGRLLDECIRHQGQQRHNVSDRYKTPKPEEYRSRMVPIGSLDALSKTWKALSLLFCQSTAPTSAGRDTILWMALFRLSWPVDKKDKSRSACTRCCAQ
jgi:hypothetical protein